MLIFVQCGYCSEQYEVDESQSIYSQEFINPCEICDSETCHNCEERCYKCHKKICRECKDGGHGCKGMIVQ